MGAKILPLDEHVNALLNGEAHSEACEFGPDDPFDLPPWYDDDKYKRGQRYIRENIFSQFTCTMSGLVCVLAVPTIVDKLVNTHKSSTLASAYARYISTMFHVYTWYTDLLRPGTQAWKSLLAVRSRHFRASKRPDSRISHRDMVLTQFVFLGAGIFAPDKIGMLHDDEDDVEAYVHFWRTIGYMLGIRDEYNICRPSLDETRRIFEIVRRDVFCHYLRRPPEYFYHMVSAVLRAMWYYSPVLNEGSFVHYTMWLYDVEGYGYDWRGSDYRVTLFGESVIHATNNNTTLPPHDDGSASSPVLARKLGLYNRFSLHILHLTHYLVSTTFGRWYFNGQTRLTIFLLKNFPFLSIAKFGTARSYIDMFKEDVAVPARPRTNREIFLTYPY